MEQKEKVPAALTARDLAALQKKQRDAEKALKAQVEELEMKARYWKAQFDIRHYTLEAEKLQPDYEVYMEEQRKINEELHTKWEEHMKKLQEEGAKIEEPEEVTQ